MSEDTPQFQYSARVERSAKGARWTVHVYSNDKETALRESIEMYDEMGKRLEEHGLAVAPIEKSKGD